MLSPFRRKLNLHQSRTHKRTGVMKGIVGATGMLCFFPGFSAPYQAMVCSLPWSKLSFFVFSAELCEKNRLTGAVDRDLDTGLDLRVWKGGFRK